MDKKSDIEEQELKEKSDEEIKWDRKEKEIDEEVN